MASAYRRRPLRPADDGPVDTHTAAIEEAFRVAPAAPHSPALGQHGSPGAVTARVDVDTELDSHTPAMLAGDILGTKLRELATPTYPSMAAPTTAAAAAAEEEKGDRDTHTAAILSGDILGTTLREPAAVREADRRAASSDAAAGPTGSVGGLSTDSHTPAMLGGALHGTAAPYRNAPDVTAEPTGVAGAAGATSAERQCRICLGGPQDEPELGRLFSPCRCKGTMKYVHVQCLNQWRKTAVKKESFYQCDQCHYQYNLQRTSWRAWLMNPRACPRRRCSVRVASALTGYDFALGREVSQWCAP